MRTQMFQALPGFLDGRNVVLWNPPERHIGAVKAAKPLTALLHNLPMVADIDEVGQEHS